MAEKIELDLSVLQACQADYDAEFWAHLPGDATIEHTLSHLAKLIGKLGTFVEARQHGEQPSTDTLVGEVIPDLAIYAARLANSTIPGQTLDLTQLVNEREAALRVRFSNPTTE